MLYDDEAGIDREVDVLVESTILSCNIKIGIECTAERAPLEIRKIESSREKHRKIGINKTIIVSKNGFSESAKKYAIKHGIRLLTFKAAQKENWLKKFERLQDLSIYGRRYMLRNVSVVMDEINDPCDFTFNDKTIVLTSDGDTPISKFAGDLFIASEVSKKAFKELLVNEKSGDDPWVEVGFTLGGKYEFKDSLGRIARPISITIVMGYQSNYRSMDTKQITYDGNDMIVGGFFDKDSSAHVAISEIDGKLKGSLEVSESFLPPIPYND